MLLGDRFKNLFISRKFTLFISHFVSLSGIPFALQHCLAQGDYFFCDVAFHVSVCQHGGVLLCDVGSQDRKLEKLRLMEGDLESFKGQIYLVR